MILVVLGIWLPEYAIIVKQERTELLRVMPIHDHVCRVVICGLESVDSFLWYTIGPVRAVRYIYLARDVALECRFPVHVAHVGVHLRLVILYT